MDNHLYSILCCKYYAYDTISIWRRVAFLYKKRKRGLFFYFLLFRRIRFHISSKLIFFSRKKNADITNTHGFVVGINRHSNRHTSEEVQVAFKVLMTHWILQFALRIAFRCVLHRCGSQDIHCWKCWIVLLFYENSESNNVLVCFFIPKECQVLFLQKKKEILFVFCVHGTCYFYYFVLRK